LAASFGRGAMTNHWIDIQHADVVMIIGSNAAENHPISFKWVQRARDKGGKLISVDPRFTRTSSLADLYAPIRPGTDIVFINGIINYALQNDLIQKEYVVKYTNAAYLIDPGFAFNDGIFSGYNPAERKYDKKTWKYQLDADGIPLKDESLQNPQCVYQLLKKHMSRYTPEKVSAATGCPVDTFKKVAELYTSTHKPDRIATILYAMGATQHTIGVQNIRAYAILQLLMGNMGMAGGGINALRGESNVQGSTDHAILWHILPGYLDAPKVFGPKKDTDLKAWIANNTPTTKDPMSVNWWQNKPKYMINLLKAWFGDNATRENDFGFDWLPKASKPHSHVHIYEELYAGSKIEGAILMGTNPVVGGPNSMKEAKALEKLNWLVCADLWETETSIFWKRPGANPKAIKTEVFLLPMASSVEKEGSVSNSGRWAQWRYKAQNPPGEAITDLDFVDRLFRAVRKLYEDDVKAGKKVANPDPILKAYWNFTPEGHHEPDPHMVAKEINGFEWKKNGEHGDQIENFTKLTDDGKTVCGNWLYSGSYNEDGNNMARRSKKDKTRMGMYHGWAWAWPMNRRIIYNRASVNMKGEPWNPKKPVIWWDGDEWKGDVPDGPAPAGEKLPFIMLPEGVGRLFAPTLNDGPFPEHYEAVESVTRNIFNSQQYNPAVSLYPGTQGEFGTSARFPYIGTSYRVTEHWQAGAMTRNLPWLDELVPDMFCEISPSLAAKKGIKNGDKVIISSQRGSIETYALVTERVQPLKVNGQMVEMVGMVWHFGYGGHASGSSCNFLTPQCGDPNTFIPEFKVFLVDIRKA